MGAWVIKYGSFTLSYSSGLDASPLYSAISMAHLAPCFPADVVGTSASPQPVPQSALGEESQEAHRLQLCLDVVQTTLIVSECETVVAEAAAAMAQAWLTGKSYWARSCSFTSCDAMSCVQL